MRAIARTKCVKQVFYGMVFVLVLCAAPLLAQEGWTTPVPVTEVDTAYDEWTPFISYDGLSLYFSQLYTPSHWSACIWEARRDTPTGPFTSVQKILDAGTRHVFHPWVSEDNLRMYYTYEDSSHYELRVSTRASEEDPWTLGTGLSELNALGNVGATTMTPDELTIIFSSNTLAGGLGGYDMYIATRPNLSSPFGNVRNLTELNTSAGDGSASIMPDGLTLYYASAQNGSAQLFKATRESLADPFGNIEHLSFFDTVGGGSGHPCMNADATAMYYVRNLTGGSGDIFVSYYVPEPASVLILALGGMFAALRRKRQ